MGPIDRRRVLQAGLPLLAAGMGVGCGKATREAAPSAQPRLGINLAEVVDWNTELPFVDLFRQSREWISQMPTGEWGKGPKLSLDESGWIRSLEPGHWADTPMCSADGGFHPIGTYTVTYEGQGEIEFWGSAKVLTSEPGRFTIDVTPSKGPIWLRLRKTDPSNPVRNIRVLLPGVDPGVARNAFQPSFVERWRGIACVRFMDWMHTNNSQQSSWKQRPKPTDARFTHKGVPVEVLVDLANALDASPWFCMPHQADDEYVREFATVVKSQLAPHLKVHIEYSNELWNGLFEQAKHAQLAADTSKQPVSAFIAERSVNLFRQWEAVFGGTERLVRIMPSQAANRFLSESLLKHGNAYKYVDALAIAPYLSLNLPPEGKGLTAGEVERWSVDMLLDHLESKALPECVEWMKSQKAIADKFGVRLVAYEGGQHLLGILGAENRERLTQLLMAANIHPRMGQLYERYFEAWAAAGGDLHCHFNSVATWSKWGSWGLLQHAAQDPKASPKFMAAMGWAGKQGQKVKLPT